MILRMGVLDSRRRNVHNGILRQLAGVLNDTEFNPPWITLRISTNDREAQAFSLLGSLWTTNDNRHTCGFWACWVEVTFVFFSSFFTADRHQRGTLGANVWYVLFMSLFLRAHLSPERSYVFFSSPQR